LTAGATRGRIRVEPFSFFLCEPCEGGHLSGCPLLLCPGIAVGVPLWARSILAPCRTPDLPIAREDPCRGCGIHGTRREKTGRTEKRERGGKAGRSRAGTRRRTEGHLRPDRRRRGTGEAKRRGLREQQGARGTTPHAIQAAGAATAEARHGSAAAIERGGRRTATPPPATAAERNGAAGGAAPGARPSDRPPPARITEQSAGGAAATTA